MGTSQLCIIHEHLCVFLLQLTECVRRGVSLLVRDSEGCSALHLAAQNGHTDLVGYILQQGEATTAAGNCVSNLRSS